MLADLLHHHLKAGMRRQKVQQLLGRPDVVEKGDTWAYRLAGDTDLLIDFNLWGGMAHTPAVRISCDLFGSARQAAASVPPNNEMKLTKAAPP
jgi:hypothetical protein